MQAVAWADFDTQHGHGDGLWRSSVGLGLRADHLRGLYKYYC